MAVTHVNFRKGPRTGTLLRVYSGTKPEPGGAETAMLAELPCDVTFSAGVLAVNFIAQAAANATGVATWCRFFESDGETLVDGTVSAVGEGGDLQLSKTAISLGGIINIPT